MCQFAFRRMGKGSDNNKDHKHSKKHRSRESSSSDRKEADREKHKRKKHHRSDKHTEDEHHHHHHHRHKTSKRSSRTDTPDSNAPTSHHSHIDQTKLYPLGQVSHIKVSEKRQLDEDRDYFAYHNHLRLYLYRKRKVYFEDMSSSEARIAFKEFCQEYNNGTLEAAYYDLKNGLPVEALEECKRTRHVWNFRTSDSEKKTLDIVKDGVRKQTEYDNDRV